MSLPPDNKAEPAIEFDGEALLEKYRQERDKRLRKDGTDQYLRLDNHADEFGQYLRDPWTPDRKQRPAIDKDVDALIIGGGIGGLMMGSRLHALGVENFHIIEKAGDFGGTWYWNRYPGIACDVESYIYMPFLEELGKIPTERYASGPEILQHCQDIGRHFDLYSKALFQTQVKEMRWDESSSRWIVHTDRGDLLRARFVTLSTGPLSAPKLPSIPGIKNFKGRLFHTSRWDYDYTGGSALGGLTKLWDKRVGIVGTGSTGIQCIPHLGRWAKHLYVFQRTPSAVHARHNRPTAPAWAESLQPGWQAARTNNFTAVATGLPVEDMIQDEWTTCFRALLQHAHLPPEEARKAMQDSDFRQMEKARRRIDEIVGDPSTAEALKPYYNQFCKRPCFHDDYLPTFNRPNVTLVDTGGKGVSGISGNCVEVGASTYEVDCLIFATGFEWYTDHEVGSGFETYGRSGVAQSKAWADGVRSLYGLFSRDFPNRFVIGNVQQPHTPNFTAMFNVMTRHLAFMIKHCLDAGITTVEPEDDAQRAWVETIVAMSESRRTFNENCTPGYYNSEGQYSLKAARNNNYIGSIIEFDKMLEEDRETGSFKGLEMR